MRKNIAAMVVGLLAVSSIAQAASASVYSYQYDANNRLKAILKDGLPYMVMVYDANGNLIKRANKYFGVVNPQAKLTYHSGIGINNYWYTASLSWQVEGTQADSYNIYQNKQFIGNSKTLSFSTGTLKQGSYTFIVSPVWNGNEMGFFDLGGVTVPYEADGGGGAS